MYRELWAEIEEEIGHRIEEAEFFRLMIERARVSPEGASTPAQISICSHCDRGWQSGTGGRAELDPAALAHATCNAEHLGSVEGEAGRKTSTLTPKKHARILARDQHRCAVPGCRSKRNLEVHHIDHQEDGGGHEDWNLITLCWGHHGHHHAGRLAIEGRAPDGLRFVWRRSENAHVGANERQRGASTFGLAAMRTQARDALVGLGWKSAIASAAVDEASAQVPSAATIEVLIREALRRCPRPQQA
jgi:hypothetical protein